MPQDALPRALTYAGHVVDAWLPLKIAYDRIPGVSVGITHRGRLVYAKGFGFADVENGARATPKTAYRIASNSKTFTAVGIMQLVERGALALDDRIATHLPWFRARAKGRDAANITIRQALSHVAGVFRDGDTPHWTSGRFPTRAQLRRSVSAQTVVYENATRFKYSNFGFAVLGAVIAKVSGSSYADYMTDNVIRPLAMKRTAPDLTPESLGWLAAGYSRPIPGSPRESFDHSATNAYASATGFLSNIEDLAKYVGALSLARNPRVLLGRESRKEMFREHWSSELDGSYGLGFGIWRVDGKKIIGHGGGFAGFITRVALNLEDDVGVIVLTNSNDSPAGFIADGILETIGRLADPHRDYFRGPRRANLSRLEGAYRSRWGDQVVVSTGSKLIAFSPQTNYPLREATVLRPVTAASFVMESPFSFDSPGERARFIGARNGARANRLIWGSQHLERIE
jgi:CubicO group peptidase (beta-lactamase class C family)